jgi:ACS family tartrate transporter-like MFS transporter
MVEANERATIRIVARRLLPLIVKGWGLSNFLVGWTIAVPEVFGIVAILIGSYAADRMQDKRWSLVGLMVLCTVGFAGLGFYATTAWALIAVALIEIGIGIARPMFWTVPPSFLSRAGLAGAIALISCFANFGGIVGPIVIGWLKTTTDSFSGGLYYIACCTLMAAIIFLAMRLTPRRAMVPAASPGE